MSYTRYRCSTAERRGAACELLEGRRLLAAGDLDPTFSGDGKMRLFFSGRDFVAHDVAIEYPSGKTVVAGKWFNNAAVTRLNVDGTIDTSFGDSGLWQFPRVQLDELRAVAIQQDGKIVVAGYDLTDEEYPKHIFAVARLTSSGMPDLSFGTGGAVHTDILSDISSSEANDVVIQRDGKIVAVGYTFYPSGSDVVTVGAHGAVVRYHPDGTLDNGFDSDGIKRVDFGSQDRLEAVTLDYTAAPTDPRYGMIAAVGTRDEGGEGINTRMAVIRLLPGGAYDNSFDGNGQLTTVFPGDPRTFGKGIVVQPSGKIVVVGSIFAQSADLALARFQVNGALDPTFGSAGTGLVRTDFGGSESAFEIANGFHGGLIVAGAVRVVPVVPLEWRPMLVAYTADGVVDTRFAGNGRVVGDATTATTATWPLNIRASVAATGDLVAPIRRLVLVGGPNVSRHIDVGPVISIGTLNPVAYEEGQVPAHFAVLRDQPLPTPQRIYLNISGTATRPESIPNRPADYTGTGITFVNPFQGTSYVDIPAFEFFTGVTITPIDDAFVEGDEHAIFTIAPHDLYDISDLSSTTLVIRDNDVAAPTVTSSSFNTETAPQRLVFSFSQDVSASFTLADILVLKLPAGPVVQLSGITHDTVLNTATVAINGLLPDGQYRATLQGSGITNSSGVPLVANHALDFFVLAGDANRDGKVDVADLGILASNWQQSPRTLSQGDLNFDGKVDVADLGILASNWQKQLAFPSAPFAGVPLKSPVRPHRLIDSVELL